MEPNMNANAISRRGFVRAALLGLAIVAGAAAGVYLTSRNEPKPPGPPASATIQRFRLTALDAKDQIESPALTCDAAGRTYLAWASKTADAERTIFLASRGAEADAFDEARVVARVGVYKTRPKGKGSGYERRATPHLVSEGSRVDLSWSEALPGGDGMRMVVATTNDSGKTFTAPQAVHRGEAAKPTFTGMAIGPHGELACCWLDDRNGVQQTYAAVRRAGRGEFDPEELVHAGEPHVGVCPCCPTAAAFAANGDLFVAFRNVRDGYRDIAVSRKKSGQAAFEETVAVTAGPTWKFDGCPHDGPSLAIVDTTLHIVWMDARSGTPRCWYGRSPTDALTFDVRELSSVPSTSSQGNARLFADAVGGLHAVWEEDIGANPNAHAGHSHQTPTIDAASGRAVKYATMPAGTSTFGPARFVAPRLGAFQSRPTLVCGPSGVFVAWYELDESGKSLVAARIANEDRS
jgi:hypothetical protein